MAIFRKKHCHRSSALIYRPILILFHTNVWYDNILDKFEFERSRAQVKFTVAIFRKTLSSLSNFNITTSNKFAFQHNKVKVKVAVTVFRKTLQFKACQASKGKNLTSSFIFITKGDNKIYGY